VKRAKKNNRKAQDFIDDFMSNVSGFLGFELFNFEDQCARLAFAFRDLQPQVTALADFRYQLNGPADLSNQRNYLTYQNEIASRVGLDIRFLFFFIDQCVLRFL
jgi:hypothetical protein